MVHDLKIWPQFFGAVSNGDKPFEVRKNDRPFAVNDYLRLRERTTAEDGYTGFETLVRVTYVLDGGMFGVERGYVVMGIRPATRKERTELEKGNG